MNMSKNSHWKFYNYENRALKIMFQCRSRHPLHFSRNGFKDMCLLFILSYSGTDYITDFPLFHKYYTQYLVSLKMFSRYLPNCYLYTAFLLVKAVWLCCNGNHKPDLRSRKSEITLLHYVYEHNLVWGLPVYINIEHYYIVLCVCIYLSTIICIQ